MDIKLNFSFNHENDDLFEACGTRLDENTGRVLYEAAMLYFLKGKSISEVLEYMVNNIDKQDEQMKEDITKIIFIFATVFMTRMADEFMSKTINRIMRSIVKDIIH